MYDNQTVLAIDIGGTKTRAAYITNKGDILHSVDKPTMADQDPGQTLEPLLEALQLEQQRSAHDQRLPVSGVGICAPGPLSTAKGYLRNPPNLPGWHHDQLTERLRQMTGAPAYLINDADAAALGEAYFGGNSFDERISHISDPNNQNLVFITVGTGIGAGIVIDGNIHPGHTNAAGEIGHATVAKDGPECFCGKRGCLAAFSSGRGLARRMAALVEQTANHPLKNQTISAKDVFKGYKLQDPIAQIIVEDAIEYLAIAIANIMQTLNPRLIALGGGMIEVENELFPKVCERIPHFALEHHLEETIVYKSTLGGQANLLGAGVIAGASTVPDPPKR